MKTEQQIKARIGELLAEMDRTGTNRIRAVLLQVEESDADTIKLLRLQGNVGALEWVLRTHDED